MSDNKGITIITLVITIIILIILASIYITTSLNALDETRDAEITSEMHSLEEAILVRYTSYIKNDKNISLIGSPPSSRWSNSGDCYNEIINYVSYDGLSTEEASQKRAKILSDIDRDYDEYVKIITYSDAIRLGLNTFLQDSIYLVDYYTTSVYGPLE